VLEQITPQLEGLVEVCVSDNGSRDGTRELVAEHIAARPKVVAYSRFEENRGFALNLLEAVEMASGTFCWLFSSDDALIDGGLRRVLDVLERQPDLTGATLRPVTYDLDARRPGARPLWPQPLPSPPEDDHRWTSVVTAVAGCGLYMGILPSQVVRRDLWLRAAEAQRAEGLDEVPLFPHLAVIYRMVADRPVWAWHGTPAYHLRVGPPNSVAARARSLTAYHLDTTEETVGISRRIFGRGRAHRALVAAVLRAVFNPVALAFYKAVPGQTLHEDVRLARGAVRWFWSFPQFWLLSVPVLLVPHGVVAAVARPARGLVRRLSGLPPA
jgi:glycosyltransferase involved in cell wall biosynthesis